MNAYKIMLSFYKNFHIGKSIIKISFFPNLFQPIVGTIVFGIAFANMSGGYTIEQIVIAMLLQVSIISVSNEMTYNLFIQLKIQKSTFSSMLAGMTPTEINLGHSIWANVRGIFFGTSYFLILLIVFNLSYDISLFQIFIILISLFLTNFIFISFAGLFTLFVKKIDYLNIYISFFLQTLLLFSNTYFKVENFIPFLQPIILMSPLVKLLDFFRNLFYGFIDWKFLFLLFIVSFISLFIFIYFSNKRMLK